MRASFRTLSEEIVAPASGTRSRPERVELAGCDQIYDHFNVKAAFMYSAVLPAPALKQALRKALDLYPMLAGRVVTDGAKQYVELNGAGAAVREQLAYVSGTDGLRHGDTHTILHKLCAGSFQAKPNDPSSPLLTITLTEVTYGESLWSCRPPLSLNCACAPSSPSHHHHHSRKQQGDFPPAARTHEAAAGSSISATDTVILSNSDTARDELPQHTHDHAQHPDTSFHSNIHGNSGASLERAAAADICNTSSASRSMYPCDGTGMDPLPPHAHAHAGTKSTDHHEGAAYGRKAHESAVDDARAKDGGAVGVGDNGGGDGGDPVIKYAVGVCFSHGVADGCGISHFMAAWLAATKSVSFPPAVNHRGALLDHSGAPPQLDKFKVFSRLGHARMMASFAINQLRCEPVIIRFSQEEIEAIKAAAMAPLQGTTQWVSTSNALAAHLWPIISELLTNGRQISSTHSAATHTDPSAHAHTHTLSPLTVVVNSRKQLGMPMNYCGNVVSIQEAPAGDVDDPLTGLALKVRAACAPPREEATTDHAYMQSMAAQGRCKNITYKSMREAVLTRPRIIWDDISSFQGGDNGDHLAFCGVRPISADLLLLNVPGMIMVVAPPVGKGGKEVRVHLLKSQARKLRSPEYMQRVHAYALCAPQSLWFPPPPASHPPPTYTDARAHAHAHAHAHAPSAAAAVKGERQGKPGAPEDEETKEAAAVMAQLSSITV